MGLPAGAKHIVSDAWGIFARTDTSERRFRRLKCSLAASGAFLLSSVAQAQVVPPLAPTREEVARPAPERPEEARARLTVEGDVERAPCALDRPEYRDIRFTLSDVQFDNLRGLPAEALRPAFAPFVGQEHPVAIICEIRDRAATILREAGYVAAVEVPEQRIADGTVRFEVLMARLVGLRVRGDAGRAERTIAGYLGQLTEREVFNRYEAERYLLLAGDLPGYNVRLALRSAGQARGEVIGEVIVQHTPTLVDFTVQNLGSSELGRWGGLVRGQFFGLTGLGDRTILAFYSTPDFDEQQTIQVAHDFRLGSDGLALGGQFTYSWARPDLGDPAIDIESRTLFATVEATYPFLRRQAQTLRGSLGLDYIDQDVEFSDIPLNRDRLRVAFARLTYDALGLAANDPRYRPVEPRWRIGGSLEPGRASAFRRQRACGPTWSPASRPAWYRRRGSKAIRPPPSCAAPPGSIGPIRASRSPLRHAASSDHPLFSFENIPRQLYGRTRLYRARYRRLGIGFGQLRYGTLFPRDPEAFTVEPFVFVTGLGGTRT